MLLAQLGDAWFYSYIPQARLVMYVSRDRRNDGKIEAVRVARKCTITMRVPKIKFVLRHNASLPIFQTSLRRVPYAR